LEQQENEGFTEDKTTVVNDSPAKSRAEHDQQHFSEKHGSIGKPIDIDSENQSLEIIKKMFRKLASKT